MTAATSTNRVLWIDLCRIIAFIYIALVHCVVLFSSRAGVALFFILAAYFAANKTSGTILKRALIVAFSTLFWQAVVSLCILHRLSDYLQPYRLVIYDLGTLWFLRELVICMVVSVVVKKLSVPWQIILVVIIATSLGVWNAYVPPESTLFALLFYNMGLLLRKIAPQDLSGKLFPLVHKVRGKVLNFVLFLVFFCSTYLFMQEFGIAPHAMLKLSITMALIALSAIFLERAVRSPAFVTIVGSVAQAGFFFYVTHPVALRLFVSCYLRTFGHFPNVACCLCAICFHFALSTVIVRCLVNRNKILNYIILAR